MEETVFYSFEQFLTDYTSNFKPYQYMSNIMYRSVCFNKHGLVYRIYCRDHKFVDEYETIQYEVKAYEKRIAASAYAGKSR